MCQDVTGAHRAPDGGASSMADIIVGRQPVLEALRAERPVNRLLVFQDSGRHSILAEILHLAQSQRIPVDFVSRLALDQASGGTAHQGVLAYAGSKAYVTQTRRISEPSSGRPMRQVSTESSSAPVELLG